MLRESSTKEKMKHKYEEMKAQSKQKGQAKVEVMEGNIDGIRALLTSLNAKK